MEKGAEEKLVNTMVVDELKDHVAYDNNPRPGYQQLPTHDADGNPITYKEWDTDPRPLKNTGGRGAERVVTGSDGSSYYTNDHYHTFNKMRDHTPRRIK